MAAPDLPGSPEGTLPARLAGALAAGAVALLARTWRRDLRGVEILDRLPGQGRRFLLLFWHGKYLPLFALLAGRRACIFSSRSFRGEVIAEICRRFGYACRVLPPEAERARELLRRTLAAASATATAADGPLGPGRRVKGGVVKAAAETGALLLPVGIESRPRLVLRRRWDRLEIPVPFARLVLVFGSPLPPPEGLEPEKIEACARLLDERLERLEAWAEALVRRRRPPSPPAGPCISGGGG